MNEMKAIMDTPKHKVLVPEGASLQLPADRREREWRNSELKRTDTIIIAGDHPDHVKILAYRQELYTYADQPSFPNGVRPKL